MFVRKSKYQAALNQIRFLEIDIQHYRNQADGYRDAALGYARLLNNQQSQQQFSLEEIKKLISLCHPDRHNGKQSANDMTVKLIAIKEAMESK